MITGREIRAWLAALPDDTPIAIDELYLVVWTPEHNNRSLERGNPSLLVGLYPIGIASGALGEPAGSGSRCSGAYVVTSTPLPPGGAPVSEVIDLEDEP